MIMASSSHAHSPLPHSPVPQSDRGRESADRGDMAAQGAPLQLAGRRIHFVGIGGCGMSGLARIVAGHGAVCSGSDLAESDTTRRLQHEGIDVAFQQTARSVPPQCDILVISAAISPDHPEVAEASRRGVTVLKYAQMLGQLMLGRTGVAIAGTHGKSSTTSMLSHVLIQTGLDPSLIVGANCEQIGGGARVGGGRAGQPAGGTAAAPSTPLTGENRQPAATNGSASASASVSASASYCDILVAEACEYDRSFHHLHPTLAAILNVEADHMDVYASLDEIVEAFAEFARKLPGRSDGGYLLVNHEMASRLTITAGLDCEVETIGFAYQADWRVGMKDGLARLHHGDEAVMDWKVPLPGEHMAYNAAVAAVLAHRLGAAWDRIAAALEGFKGLDRRMQVIGRCGPEAGSPSGGRSLAAPTDRKSSATNQAVGEILVVDDYGHHPTEVDTTLRALRQHYRPGRLICVFQPHQHSRTRFLMQQFAVSFGQADVVIVPDIYFVRDSEEERAAVTANDLVERLCQQGVEAMHLSPLDAIVDRLEAMTQPGDLVVTMGAGDVWKVAKAFVAAVNP